LTISPRSFSLAAVILVGAAAILFIVRRGTVSPPVARRNIVLITIDTLRADRVGRGIAPNLDRFAAGGLRFTNARTAVPLTLPSHVSLMTGTIPPVHGVRENGVRFRGGVPTLVRVLRDQGYRTAAFVGAYVLDRRFGLADGFETYDDRVHRDPNADARLEAERRGGEVVDAALAWLDKTSTPFFLWVHLYDPHAPYDPPAEYRTAGMHPYDGEVRYADAQLARILERLDSRKLDDSTVRVVASDHGEGLGEHGEQTHGLLAYDSTLKVPLAIAAPGIAPREVSAAVSLVDVAPAVLRLAGVQASLSKDASQNDLLDPRRNADVYAETQYPRVAGWHPLTVLAGEQWKLIASSERELFDLQADSQETRNVAAERERVAEGMAAVLAPIGARATATASGSIDAEAAARLRALGYVGGSSSTTAVDASAPNPARHVDAWTSFEKALANLNAGFAADAAVDLRKLAAEFPNGLVFQTSYARALQDSGKPGDAMRVLRAAVDRWPTDASLFHDLAVAARAAGDRAEAARAEQAALALDADSPSALNGLGLLHADAGRSSEAVAAFERAANADPTNASYWSNLGNARRELGQLPAAETAYRRALDIDPSHPDAANGLGVLLVQTGRAADAVKWFEAALRRAPDFHEARLNLGIAYQESGQREKAVETYRHVLATATPKEKKAAGELLKSLR
jgi:arylsulfatase A-like enzyme/Flp pilus assembly protein TadD